MDLASLGPAGARSGYGESSLSILTPKSNAICWAMRGQSQLGLRRFIAMMTSMSSSFGTFGPGRPARCDENNMRYFRFLSTCGDAGELQASQRWQNEAGGTGP